MTASQKLHELGLTLPTSTPVGAYVPCVRAGNLLFTSGQIALKDGRLLFAGKVPAEVTLDQAAQAARQCCLNALGALAGQAGSLDAVTRVVRMNVFVNSSPGFVDQAKVANAASQLLLDVFGAAGAHTRCAIGAAELPLNSPVELDMVVEVGS